MELNKLSPSPDNADAKAAFRKPSNDAGNRKYRRRSPVSGSSSSDGSPKREHSSSPINARENSARDLDLRQRKDDRRVLDKDSGWNHRGRSGDSYGHSDRQSSRSSHNYNRRDDYVRHEKHRDEEERNYKSSSRSGRDLRVGTRSDHTRRESEHYKSRDHVHGDDKYSRDRSDGSGNRIRDKDKDSFPDRAVSGRRHTNSNLEDIKSGERDRHKGDGDGRDEKRDIRRSSEDYKGDLSPIYEESMGRRNDLTSRRDSSKHRSKDPSKSDPRELDDQRYSKEEKKNFDDRETRRHKDRYNNEPGEQFEDGPVLTSENQEYGAKKPKFNLGSDYGKDVSKQAQELVGKAQSSSSEQATAKGPEAANDIDAAKVAAMKAAELVNRNLVGTGYMSTDQKKKLLWGNKKNTTTEESGRHWDTTLFPDRERQEKFNKLMGVKGEPKVEHKPDNQQTGGQGLLQAEKQREVQLDLEKQYTAGLRRRDGRTVGLGL
ncbi:hypothetical protein U1Q18_013773 [Sarracenia purpurea var. burkii]